jgi:uncharacterized protein (DUF2235 family)
MAKNVVVCCDGTANEFAANNTNVVKLYSTLVHNSPAQVTFYHPGLGTMEPAGALTGFGRFWTKLLGKAIGYGLANDVRDAYCFLMQNYQEGDRLFLFGFSRGAYTVRAVSSLLRLYGLILPGNEPLVPYAIRMMMGAESAKQGDPRKDQYFELAREFKAAMSRACQPHFVGVWDTVSSVGWIENPLHLPYSASNSEIAIGRHAISIDERRAFFRTNLWRPVAKGYDPGGPLNLKQIWFAGVHCDVGGGYTEKESGLSKIALEWMLNEAKGNGLLIDPAREAEVLGRTGDGKYAPPDPKGPIHESLTGLWNIAEFIFKRHYNWTTGKDEYRMNLYRRRTIPSGSIIHPSVFERGGYEHLLPPDAKPGT